jgi:hypothetical protein
MPGKQSVATDFVTAKWVNFKEKSGGGFQTKPKTMKQSRMNYFNDPKAPSLKIFFRLLNFFLLRTV